MGTDVSGAWGVAQARSSIQAEQQHAPPSDSSPPRDPHDGHLGAPSSSALSRTEGADNLFGARWSPVHPGQASGDLAKGGGQEEGPPMGADSSSGGTEPDAKKDRALGASVSGTGDAQGKAEVAHREQDQWPVWALQQLHNELLDFVASLAQPQGVLDTITAAQRMVQELACKAFKNRKLSVLPFGSQPMGLGTPSSDLDLVVEGFGDPEPTSSKQ